MAANDLAVRASFGSAHGASVASATVELLPCAVFAAVPTRAAVLALEASSSEL